MLETLANKMTLAEGVLDGTEKSLHEAKLKRGPDANLARLQQILAIVPEGKPAPKAPPADPALAFAERAAATLGTTLLHCQEAILPGQARPSCSPCSAIARRASRPRSAPSAKSTGAAMSPPSTSSTNPLGPPSNNSSPAACSPSTPAPPAPSPAKPPPAPPALTAEQLQRIADLKAFAAKKEKVAGFLIAEDLADEAEPHQKAAAKALAQAHAIESDPAGHKSFISGLRAA